MVDVADIVLIHAHTAVSHAVSRCDEFAPFNLRMRVTHRSRDIGRRLPDKFEVAQGGVVRAAIGDEGGPVQSICAGQCLVAGLDMSWARNRQPRASWFASDIDDFPLDVWTQLHPKCPFGNQIDPSFQQVFDVELRAEEPLRRCGSVKLRQKVDVAVVRRLIAGEGTDQGQLH